MHDFSSNRSSTQVLIPSPPRRPKSFNPVKRTHNGNGELNVASSTGADKEEDFNFDRIIEEIVALNRIEADGRSLLERYRSAQRPASIRHDGHKASSSPSLSLSPPPPSSSKRAKSLEMLFERSDKQQTGRRTRSKFEEYNWTRDKGSFKNLLINENIIIIEKAQPEPEAASGRSVSRSSHGSGNQSRHSRSVSPDKERDGSQTPKNADSKTKILTCEMPEPNVVQKVKDIYETLSKKKPKDKISDKKTPPVSANVGRSVSLRVANADRRRNDEAAVDDPKTREAQPNSSQRKKTKDGKKRSLTLPAKLDLGDFKDSADGGEEEEVERDWINACSPISPNIIQRIREQGISVTFFGNQVYYSNKSVRNAPVPSNPENGTNKPDGTKPRIIGVMPKLSSGRTPSSLSSSGPSSDDESHLGTAAVPYGESVATTRLVQRYNSYISGGGEDNGLSSYDRMLLGYLGGDEDHLANAEDSFNMSSLDDYSYDVVYLNDSYPRSRSSTPRLGPIFNGIWMQDPHWQGSSYIIFDFRGTDVQPHIRTDTPKRHEEGSLTRYEEYSR